MNAPVLENPYGTLIVTETADAPFGYFLADRCLEPQVSERLLAWLERDAPWSLVETDFYAQYEFDLRDAGLPAELAPLVETGVLDHLRGRMSELLGARLGPDVQVVAHRLEAGQRIGIHNDVREGGETHRLTIQLNRGLDDGDGGFFMLFDSDDASDVHRILRPLSGTAIGFAIGPTSHHAVSQVHGGTRYTIVYSFHADRH